MKLALIILGALAVLALLWWFVLPQFGMGAQVAAWREYRRRKEEKRGDDGK